MAEAASASDAPLLRTKLHIPHVRPDLVTRPRLVEQLQEWSERALTLIAALAGFGKTTLGNIIARLTCKEGDNLK